MKKTLIALMALVGVATGADYTYNANLIGSEDKASVHGFSFTLTSANIEPSSEGTPLTSELGNAVTLNGFTLGDRSNAAGDAVNFGLLVLDSDDVIVGMSNETTAPCDGVDGVYTFSGLTINPSVTYNFVCVREVLLNSDYVGYTYNFVKGENLTVDSEAMTITGGLLATGIAVDLHGDKQTSGLNFSTNPNINGYQATWSPILTDIKVSVESIPVPPAVPEPATATLSLLALAGLAARRRRK